jgi:hypothetical protein
MMPTKVPLELVISAELDAEITEMAREAGIERADVLRRGLAVMKAFQMERREGRKHLGFVSDPGQLDTEIINVL